MDSGPTRRVGSARRHRVAENTVDVSVPPAAPAPLDGIARGHPVLQLALAGRWEEATTLSPPSTHHAAKRLFAELPAEGDDVALELLWPGPPIVFVGARHVLHDQSVMHLLVDAERWSPMRALRVLGGATSFVPIASALGAVNAWQSLRALDLPLPTNNDRVTAALRSRPDLAECSRPVALEVVYRGSREAWWGVEVSERIDGRHVVTRSRVMAALVRHEPRCLREPL